MWPESIERLRQTGPLRADQQMRGFRVAMWLFAVSAFALVVYTSLGAS